MNSDEAKPQRRKRRLSVEERTLWTGVTRSIMPLRVAAPDAPAPPEPPAAPLRKHPPKMPAKIKSPSPPPAAAKPQPPAAPPLVSLGRREKKRVARGADTIDGRLDLHGLTQAEAHDALFGFLMQAQSRGARIVLVITGKGGDDPSGGRGVLKRQVPFWLGLPAFRSCIVGFEAAAIGHGGAGALYVRMRRIRA